MIELVARKNRDEKRQIAFIKVDGQEFSVGNVPISCDTDQKVIDHLTARKDEIALVLLRKKYPEADIFPFKAIGKTDPQAFKDWIAAGCINKVQTGQDEEGKAIYGEVVVQVRPITYKIPKEIAARAALDSAKTLAELKAAVKAIMIGE